MKEHVFGSFRLFLALTVLLGLGYPALVWAIGRVTFRDKADGSLVPKDNVTVGSSLIGLFIPRMVERRRGWMLVLASTASFQPVPYLSTYAATKAFDRFFALGVAAEVARFGVKITALCPGTTESEFFEVAGASVFRGRDLQSAEDVARIAIRALAPRQRLIVPKWSGKATAFFVRFLPVNLITGFVEKFARPKQ